MDCGWLPRKASGFPYWYPCILPHTCDYGRLMTENVADTQLLRAAEELRPLHWQSNFLNISRTIMAAEGHIYVYRLLWPSCGTSIVRPDIGTCSKCRRPSQWGGAYLHRSRPSPWGGADLHKSPPGTEYRESKGQRSPRQWLSHADYSCLYVRLLVHASIHVTGGGKYVPALYVQMLGHV